LEKTAHRVQALTSKHQAQLVSNLLDNLESDSPASALCFVSKPSSSSSLRDPKTNILQSNRSTMGCFNEAIFNSCKKENCQFSHQWEDLQATVGRIVESLQQSKYFHEHLKASLSPKQSPQNSTKILRRSDSIKNDVPDSEKNIYWGDDIEDDEEDGRNSRTVMSKSSFKTKYLSDIEKDGNNSDY
jgi:hypothetical protein